MNFNVYLELLLTAHSAFAQAFPDTVGKIFKGHWESWFNQPDVDALADAGINTVRIPVSDMTLVIFFSCHLAWLLDH
ncbi:hypothetical protein B0H14DRAFT_2423496 [Mycena olivaceomarginata]|nr:hypothetical protein B0H14DRAFT_2423496 [Mycena olivaceomarginata]